MNTTNSNNPDFVRPELAGVLAELTLCDDLLAGTGRMHAKSSTYIKKWPDEKTAVYDMRRVSETVFEGFGRTISAATGMLFSKPPAMDWNGTEATLEDQAANIDGEGAALPVFVKRFSEAAIRDGLALILVDHTPAPEGVQVTSTNEKDFGLRPNWGYYSRSQAINWRTEKIKGQKVLTLLVLHEVVETTQDSFGIMFMDQYRVLRLAKGVATWEVWQAVLTGENKGAWKITSQGTFKNRSGNVADFIPVAIAYTGRTDSPLSAKIPLMGVAYANKAHWEIMTNLRFNSDVVGFSQLVVAGELATNPKTKKPYPLQIGPLTAIQVQQGGTATWEGPDPAGLDQLEKRAQEKIVAMAQQGMSFLQTDTRAAETAEAKRLDASAENSTLATAAQAIEDAVNLAWEYHAWFEGLERTTAPVLTINRDFDSTTMQPDLLTAYVNAIVNAGLPVRILTEAMQKGGLIGPDEDLDDLDAEVMANAAAAEEAKRQAEQDKLDQLTNPQKAAA